MDQAELEKGKRRVREILIEPLNAMGMVKKSSVPVAAHAAALEQLESLAAYLPAEDLEVLRGEVMLRAGGKDHDQWPPVINIMKLARAILEPPKSDSQMVASVIGSSMGKRAARNGWLVELYRFMKREGRVPQNEYEQRQLLKISEDNRRKVINARAARDAGRAVSDDLQFLSRYEQDKERAETLLPDAVRQEVAA